MIDAQIKLSAIWIVVMMIYFLGDVLRIISGDVSKAMANQSFNQFVWLGIAALMLIPILMIFLTLVLPQPVNRWVNIGAAGFFFLFNLIGLPTYPSLYDKFLLIISMVFNAVTVWYAWNWV